MKDYVATLKPADYLRRYLEIAPLSLALSRSIEAKNIAQVAMKRPILDIGCGFGEFAGVFFESQVEVGVDISWKDLFQAKKGKRYKKLKRADARGLPFKDQSFNTVLSISTFEHIENVGPVIKEIRRVLKPGGQLVFTIIIKKLDRLLFFPSLFKKIGLPSLAKFYVNLFHKAFKNKTIWTRRKWETLLKNNGFKIKVSQEILSPKTTKIFDFFLLTAWPSQIFKIIFGWRWAWRPKWFREFLVRRFSGLVEAEAQEGSNLFVVAVKR